MHRPNPALPVKAFVGGVSDADFGLHYNKLSNPVA